MLLLTPDRIVSHDDLTEAVWGGTPPATARNQIAICVTALRRIFREAAGTDDLIRTAHPGYALTAGSHHIDLRELDERVNDARAAVRAGRFAEGADHFEQAIALWRGRALEGLTGSRIEDTATGLTELWLDVNEEHAAAQLELGRHRSLITSLSELVREFPLREQARAHLMLAHHRSGRRAEALEIFREGRRVLVEELGIEPGTALQELHHLILSGAEELNPAPVAATPAPAVRLSTSPAQLPLASASFTGRAAESAVLDRLLDDRGEQSPLAIAAISGVSGVGKSALAVHWANSATDVFPDGQLFMDLRGYHEHDQPLGPSAVLDQFLRALGVPQPQIPDHPQERAALYRSILDGKRVLIVLDNARSFDQIQPLLPGHGGCCVIITGRDALDDLAGDYAAVRIDLNVMDPDEAAAMLGAVVGAERMAAAPEATARLIELCDRLPLALRVAGARLTTRPHWSVGQLVTRLEDHRRRLDELSPGESGVRAGFWLSYRNLTPAAARMYRRLGLLTVPDFAAWVGAAVLDTDVLEAEDLIEQLVDAQLLETCPGPPGGPTHFRFQNLLRLFAWERAQAEDSEADRAAALERAFGTWLTLADRAHGMLYGRDLTEHHASLGVTLPARRVEELLTEPIEWFESERAAIVDVVEQAAQTGHATHAWALASRAVPLFETRNYLDDWRDTATRGLAAARGAGDRVGEGTMLRSLGTLAIYRRRYEQAESWLTPALPLLKQTGQLQGHAIALRNLAVCARFAGDLPLAASRCRAALDDFERTDDLAGRSHALGLLAQIELESGNTALGMVLSTKAIAASQEAGSPRGRAQNVYRLAEALLRAGEAEQAEQACLEVIMMTRSQGDVLGEAHGLRGLGEAQWRQNRPHEAVQTLTTAVRAANDVHDRFLLARIETDLGCAQAIRGNDAAASWLERAHEAFRSLTATSWQEYTARLLDAVRAARPGKPSVVTLSRLIEN